MTFERREEALQLRPRYNTCGEEDIVNAHRIWRGVIIP